MNFNQWTLGETSSGTGFGPFLLLEIWKISYDFSLKWRIDDGKWFREANFSNKNKNNKNKTENCDEFSKYLCQIMSCWDFLQKL